MTVKCWIDYRTNDDYTQGDQPSQFHIEISQRPDSTYDWNGDTWIQNQDKVNITTKPTIEEQLSAIRKAIVKGDNSDIIAINTKLENK